MSAEIHTAGAIAAVTWPQGARFRIVGSRVEWEEVDPTPTKVRLRYWKRAPGAWYHRAVTRYVTAETPLEVLRG